MCCGKLLKINCNKSPSRGEDIRLTLCRKTQTFLIISPTFLLPPLHDSDSLPDQPAASCVLVCLCVCPSAVLPPCVVHSDLLSTSHLFISWARHPPPRRIKWNPSVILLRVCDLEFMLFFCFTSSCVVIFARQPTNQARQQIPFSLWAIGCCMHKPTCQGSAGAVCPDLSSSVGFPRNLVIRRERGRLKFRSFVNASERDLRLQHHHHHGTGGDKSKLWCSHSRYVFALSVRPDYINQGRSEKMLSSCTRRLHGTV